MIDYWKNNNDRGRAGKYEKRGWEEYSSKGLDRSHRILDNYEEKTGNGINNTSGEWCIAYYNFGRNSQLSQEISWITGIIYKKDFKL